MKAQIRFGVWGRRITSTSAAEPIEVLGATELTARIGQITHQPPKAALLSQAETTAAVQYTPLAPEPARWRRHLRPR